MIKVLKSYKDKKYFAKCPKCTSELEYQKEDVEYMEYTPSDTIIHGIGTIPNYIKPKSKTILCPECKTRFDVYLLTKEETQNTIINH